MEEKSELNNIVIDDEQEGKVQNSKKFLLIGAAAIVLFLVVLVSVYSLNQEEEEVSPLAQAQDSLVPQQKADSMLESQDDRDAKFEQVPISDESPKKEESVDKFDEIVKEIQSKQKNITDVEPANLPPPPRAEIQPQEKEVLSQTKVVPKESVVPQNVETDSVIKSLVEQTTSNKAEVNDVPKGWYIQVGSFSRFTPNDKFLNTIKENGFEYHILKTKSGDKSIQKVLVGPFKSRDEARDANVKVREEINKEAFLKKI